MIKIAKAARTGGSQIVGHKSPLPEKGSVLGIDIGYSPTRRSSAVCRLDWTKTAITWTIRRFKACEPERSSTLEALADRSLLAAAFDGPMRRGFDEIGKYRVAEAMLTRRLQPLIGKPGQASAPVGKMLNGAANECARLVLNTNRVGGARHRHPIDASAVVEAFPSAFMGVLLVDPKAVAARRSNRSDAFYAHLAENGMFDRLAEFLLPGRRAEGRFADIKDHDDTAALVCALTALCVAGQSYSAVGDEDGWIILPPSSFIEPWAAEILTENAKEFKQKALHL